MASVFISVKLGGTRPHNILTPICPELPLGSISTTGNFSPKLGLKPGFRLHRPAGSRAGLCCTTQSRNHSEEARAGPPADRASAHSLDNSPLKHSEAARFELHQARVFTFHLSGPPPRLLRAHTGRQSSGSVSKLDSCTLGSAAEAGVFRHHLSFRLQSPDGGPFLSPRPGQEAKIVSASSLALGRAREELRRGQCLGFSAFVSPPATGGGPFLSPRPGQEAKIVSASSLALSRAREELRRVQCLRFSALVTAPSPAQGPCGPPAKRKGLQIRLWYTRQHPIGAPPRPESRVTIFR